MKKDTAQVAGIFSTPEDATNAITALKKAGLDEVSLYSPFDPEEADIPVAEIKSPVGRFTACGAVFGAISGLVFTVGTAMLYPVETGGMPVLSLPAIAIISFDLMLLFAVLFTIAGFIYCGILSRRRKSGLPENLGKDCFGINIEGDEKTLASATKVLKEMGTGKIVHQTAQLCLALFIVAALPMALPRLVFAWPWSQDMVHQPARKAQSEEIIVFPSAVPRHRTDFEATDKAQAPGIPNPTDVSPESLKRGKVLYERFCVLCHGSEGKGKGIIAEKIGELPDFTEPAFRNQPGGCIYFAITNGANFRKAVFPSEVSALGPLEEGGGQEHSHDDEHSHGDPMFAEDNHGHAHDEGLRLEDEHSHGDPMFAEDDHDHAHDEGLSLDDEHAHGDPLFVEDDHGHDHDAGLRLEDEHAHGDPMFAEDHHEHDGGHGHDDGHAHEHGGGNECNSGHVHAPGEGHRDSGHGHGDEAGGEHGGGKKHFMPPHRDAILSIDRWHIVNYMKHALGQ